jgi:hypothetical protein
MKRSKLVFVLLLSLSVICIAAACKKLDKSATESSKKAEATKGQTGKPLGPLPEGAVMPEGHPDITGKKTAGPLPEGAVMPEGHPDISGQKAAQAPAEIALIKGKVKETMNSSGYTYVLLDSNGRDIWVAIPETKVTVGKEVSFESDKEMKNFYSKALNRTFETIIFSAGVAGKPKKQAVDDFMKKHTAEKETPGTISGKVVETMDSAGYTYVSLEKDGKRTWVAIPLNKIKVGSTMSFKPGNEMVNFKSDSLKRTFKTIIFSDGPIE